MFPLHDANPRHRPSFVMWLLVAANVVIFLYMVSLGAERALMEVIRDYAFVPSLFFADPLGESYRLVSSVFLHGGLMHVLGNMWFLWVFGDNVEDRMGHGTFLIFYLVAGALATLAHALVEPGSSVPLVGASGAVSAVLGAYLVLFPRQRILTFIPPFFLFWLPAWLYLGYWGLIQFLQAASGALVGEAALGGVAWWAHVGGFVFGMLSVRFLARR
jgi:membrane associated rhomboid family serine protease